MAKYQSTAESLQAMKDIYNNAYENDPEFAEGWDAYFGLIGETYNPQFSYPDMVTKNEL